MAKLFRMLITFQAFAASSAMCFAPVCVAEPATCAGKVLDTTSCLGAQITCPLSCSSFCSTCASPPSPPPAPPPAATTVADPHLHFAHGGVADFRGTNGTFYSLLSAPGIQFAAMTSDTKFILPRSKTSTDPVVVDGSFFIQAAWTVRGKSNKTYGIVSAAGTEMFDVFDAKDGSALSVKRGVWQSWSQDGVQVTYKQSTLVVRANGWEVNATRKPIYHFLSGVSRWRFDTAMRKLDATSFADDFGTSSKTCFPHGLVGQSWDGDEIAVSGKVDDYTPDPDQAFIKTSAMAEGAIEGESADYVIASAMQTDFVHSRFEKSPSDVCPPRDVEKLFGAKFSRKSLAEGAFSTEPGQPETQPE